MNKYVNAFYEASEIFEDDLDILALAFVQVREKKDKRRPKNIKELTQECNFRLLHPYAKRICNMSYKEVELLKEKINTKAIKTKNNKLNLFDFSNNGKLF